MITRRGFLTAAAGAAGMALLPGMSRQEAPFKLALQTFSLRHHGLDGALALIRKLGLEYAEFYPGRQMPVTADPEKIQAYAAKLGAHGVRILSYGVIGLGNNLERNREVFMFAKGMGFDVIVANPVRDALRDLSALAGEYGKKVALHHRKTDDLLEVARKSEGAIGACVDTAYCLGAGEDPAEVIGKLGPNVLDVHLRNAEGLDLAGVLQALKETGYAGCLALKAEPNPEDPADLESLETFLASAREAITKLKAEEAK
jgi:sugar phosphate isomerase/epimerase